MTAICIFNKCHYIHSPRHFANFVCQKKIKSWIPYETLITALHDHHICPLPFDIYWKRGIGVQLHKSRINIKQKEVCQVLD